MRIAFTSDVHCDVTEANGLIVPYLVEEIKTRRSDVFIIAGDVANSLSELDECLGKFSELSCAKLFAPGNHDLWVDSKNAVKKRKEDSWWRYRIGLPAVCERNGFHYLPGHPKAIDGIGFAGSVGWYDYSLRDPALDGVFGDDDYARGWFQHPTYVQGIWNDVRLCYWLKHPDSPNWKIRSFQHTTREVFQIIFAQLMEDTSWLASRTEAQVVGLHTNPFPNCIERKQPPDPFDAYEGSDKLGEALSHLSTQMDVRCICGHRHKPLDVTTSGVRVLRSPVGYLHGFDGDLRAQAAAAIGVFDI